MHNCLEPAARGAGPQILSDLAAPDRRRISPGSTWRLSTGRSGGEGETQIFLTTAKGTPAAIIVQHKPNQPSRWSASFSEVVDAANAPPARIRCNGIVWPALPEMLPAAANLGETQADKDQAVADYLLVFAVIWGLHAARVFRGAAI
jgi:antitoxin (DNA-binding transcriptional repressor) of toxin-antitoxin stability system